ncbi:hypothetical protein AWW66_31245 [Micromonospora rosaria]|uniref:Uncharacterized protein n=1 Tax=Micromonospora rosaria TaxID=47874 RepID=A0A136PIG5_9ACTN|nr:hypothetical protein AWW66_31245 [Micromonospora rosaria]
MRRITDEGEPSAGIHHVDVEVHAGLQGKLAVAWPAMIALDVFGEVAQATAALGNSRWWYRSDGFRAPQDIEPLVAGPLIKARHTRARLGDVAEQ